jgi:uncharacterized protein
MKLGEFNDLTILRFTSVGAYLGDEQDNEVLLPNKYLTEEMLLGELVNVFLYKDSEDRIVATTETPLINLNSFAYLKVKEVNGFGAFLDWGLEKDLLVPFREQTNKLEEEKFYLIYLKYDNLTDRLVGSAKVNKYFSKETEELEEGQEVNLLICETTDLGVKVVVENKYQGVIYHNDISRNIRRGDYTIGYITQIRPDNKLDIRLDKVGYEKIDESTDKLFNLIQNNHGVLYLTDKSHPDEIRQIAGMSKKTFKKAVGNLYKKKIISLKEDSITLA